ncbi:MAG: hypothetical protein PHC64_07870 [Candidatus Gastranaerophilales bacterium]|nr:hypothetical protein [Candidatus Gastranaerophilales bacterium]
MEDKFFDIDEAMIDYAEMTSFDFKSQKYLAVSAEKESSEYLQPYTFKYGDYDILDLLKSMFTRVSVQKN